MFSPCSGDGRCFDGLGVYGSYVGWNLKRKMFPGVQATGGVLTDWESMAPTWDTIGFPIVQVEADGNFVLTKPKGTGGAVTTMTAAEQMLYEIGDPQ